MSESKLPVAEIPLPKTRHLPGSQSTPDSDFLHSIASRASNDTTDANAANNVAWLYGIRLFNSSYYWEAHEVWEAVWMKAAPNSLERSLLQACIHLTNAELKLVLDKSNAAARLYQLALQSLERALGADSLMGVSLQHLRELAEGRDHTCVTNPIIDCQYLQ